MYLINSITNNVTKYKNKLTFIFWIADIYYYNFKRSLC